MSDLDQGSSIDSSVDTIFDGRVEICQPAQGYRFSVDAPLLVWFAASDRPARRCLDLGAGCGVVGLGLLAADVADRVVAVEAQQRLAALCQRNARANELADRFELVVGDLREVATDLDAGTFDLVVVNPPFWPAGKGRLPADQERRLACHEVLVTIDEWVGTARHLLDSRRGRLCVVFPGRRLDELLMVLAQHRLSATRILPVYPQEQAPGELVLVEARGGAPGRLSLDPPLVLKTASGADTEAARHVLDGHFSTMLRSLPDRRQE
jgi:tRNA1Val (adenine37-N6)-methyltransferase